MFTSGYFCICRGGNFGGITVGIAYVGVVCSSLYSVGLSQDQHSSMESVGTTVAHELGHLLNMEHDDYPESM